MTWMDHNIPDAALKQLETALVLFDKEDYYSAITLAGAAEEIFGEFRLRLLRTCFRRDFEREEFKACFASEGMSSQTRSLSAVSDDLLKVWDEGDAKLLESKEDPYLYLLASEEGPAKLRNKLIKSAKTERELLKELKNIVEENLKNLEASGIATDPCKPLLDRFKRTFDWNKPSLDSMADAVAQGCENRGNSDNFRKDVVWIASWVKNILKHGFPGQPEVIKFDAQDVATDTLKRAILNYFGLTGNETSAMKNFMPSIRRGAGSGADSLYDGAQYQLRVELLGGGPVVTFDVPNGATSPTGFEVLNRMFTRTAGPDR